MKKIVFISTVFIQLFAFCPSCVCTESTSGKGSAEVKAVQFNDLEKAKSELEKTLNNLKKLEELKKEEQKRINELLVIAKQNTIALKQSSQEAKKIKNKMVLELKNKILKSKTLTLREKKELIKYMKSIK